MVCCLIITACNSKVSRCLANGAFTKKGRKSRTVSLSRRVRCLMLLINGNDRRSSNWYDSSINVIPPIVKEARLGKDDIRQTTSMNVPNLRFQSFSDCNEED
jgi:hypothetical protein